MFHFRRRVALGVNVADFFQLECPFQGEWKQVMSAQVKHVTGAGEPVRDTLHYAATFQRLTNQVGQGTQLANKPFSLGTREVPQPAQVQGEHGQDHHLSGECLGAGNADLGARVEVDAAVRLARDGRPHHVANREGGVALSFRFPNRGQGVSGLPGLGQGEYDRVLIDGRVAVAEFAGVFDLHGQAGKFLEKVLTDQGRVVTGSARRHDHPVDLSEPFRAEVQAAKVGSGVAIIEPAAHGVGQCVGLFEDFFQHEMAIVARVCLRPVGP